MDEDGACHIACVGRKTLVAATINFLREGSLASISSNIVGDRRRIETLTQPRDKLLSDRLKPWINMVKVNSRGVLRLCLPQF